MGQYHLKRDNSVKSSDERLSGLFELTQKYPLYLLEDPLAEADWEGWQKLTARLGDTHQIVGDDLLVTQS